MTPLIMLQKMPKASVKLPGSSRGIIYNDIIQITTPIINDPEADFAKDLNILENPDVPIILCMAYKSRIRFNIDAQEVERANPPCPSEGIRITEKTIFAIIEITAVITGVLTF